ncbi:MAG TPA: ABC transporter permease [bacterium]|nr:ABC transporter permease [bacterium]
MKTGIAFWNILLKDMKNYYLKPPNISWGIIFPFAWMLMFLVRTGGKVEDVYSMLPGLMALSILFGTTSMLAVTITFERRGRSFDRLLLAPVSLTALMLAKTGGAVFFGMINAFVPLAVAPLFAAPPALQWPYLLAGVFFVAVTSTLLGLFIAVSVSEVFEAQTFSNFFRFPMIFLCGLFFPLERLPIFIRPLSYAIPLTYGVSLLKTAFHQTAEIAAGFSLIFLILSAITLFWISRRNIQKRWIL